TALSRPSLTGQQQAQIVIDLCGEELNGQVQNFIRILAQHKRLGLTPDIVVLFERLKANQERTVAVDVLTAFPLADEAQQQLAESLKARLQRDVSINSEVDNSLIGGVVLRAGDLVIDGSVRGKLKKLAEAMNS
ncbi:MAG: F0F1 ATP synthase subunit delta, partial [Haliea sp.]